VYVAFNRFAPVNLGPVESVEHKVWIVAASRDALVNAATIVKEC